MNINYNIMIRLIELYCLVSGLYHNTLKMEVQRFSPNAFPNFADEEILTTYISDHFYDYLPKLPCYQEYVRRINLLASAFVVMTEILVEKGLSLDIIPEESVLDSYPIILAYEKRMKHAKWPANAVVRGIAHPKTGTIAGLNCSTRLFPANPQPSSRLVLLLLGLC